MSLPVSFSPKAKSDIDKALRFHKPIRPQLTLLIPSELQNTIGLLQQNTSGGVGIRGTIRQFPMERFAYFIVYDVKLQQINVVRVFNTRQHPEQKLRLKR